VNTLLPHECIFEKVVGDRHAGKVHTCCESKLVDNENSEWITCISAYTGATIIRRLSRVDATPVVLLRTKRCVSEVAHDAASHYIWFGRCGAYIMVMRSSLFACVTFGIAGRDTLNSRRTDLSLALAPRKLS
jgi:hypothetical protein